QRARRVAGGLINAPAVEMRLGESGAGCPRIDDARAGGEALGGRGVALALAERAVVGGGIGYREGNEKRTEQAGKHGDPRRRQAPSEDYPGVVQLQRKPGFARRRGPLPKRGASAMYGAISGSERNGSQDFEEVGKEGRGQAGGREADASRRRQSADREGRGRRP